jgi:hypothetical protein
MNAAKSDLILQSQIDERVGELVIRAEKLMESLGDEVRKIEANQIKNVLAVANSAPHPAVVINFIRYQMGRHGAPRKAWRDTKLGEKVVAEIEGRVKALAGDVARAANYANQDDVHARLVRLFLGFLNRSFVYHSAKYNRGS